MCGLPSIINLYKKKLNEFDDELVPLESEKSKAKNLLVKSKRPKSDKYSNIFLPARPTFLNLNLNLNSLRLQTPNKCTFYTVSGNLDRC